MKKHVFTLLALSVLYLIIYVLNIVVILANYSAIILGGVASLSFASQLNFAAWGFPLALAITGAVFLMDAGYISFNSSKK